MPSMQGTDRNQNTLCQKENHRPIKSQTISYSMCKEGASNLMCMNNIFGLMYENHRPKDLKINTPNPIREVKIQEVPKEKIENKMALETSETSDTNARPSFKFPLPKPIYTKVSENT